MSDPEKPIDPPDPLPQDQVLMGLLDGLANGTVLSPSKSKPKKKPVPIQPQQIAQITQIHTVEVKAEENIGGEALRGAASKIVPILGETIDNFRADRDQQQSVIAHLQDLVFNNPKIKPAVIESLVNAMKVKSESNANFSRMLDSIAKIISAGKGEFSAKQTQTNTSALSQLLSDNTDDIDIE